MKPGALVTVLIAITCAAPLRAQTSSASRFGEVVEVNVVSIEVYATGKDGAPVHGLKKEDFTVFEDGKPVEVTNFAAFGGILETPGPAAPTSATAPQPTPAAAAEPTASPENPLNLVIFVDNLHIRPENRTRVLEQVRRFLSQIVRPNDRVLVATYDRGLHVRQPFTQDHTALDTALKEIEKLPGHGGEADRARMTALRTLLTLQEVNVKRGDPCSLEIVTPVESYAQAVRQDVLSALSSLTFLVNSLAGIPGRKALLHVSDGLPLTPGEELFQVLAEICGGGAATSGLTMPAEVGVWDASLLGPSAYQAQRAALDALKFNTTKEITALVAHANANRVTFYPIQATGLRGTPAAEAAFDGFERVMQLPSVHQVQTTNLQNSLSAMAVGTGGRAIFNANDVTPDLGRVRQDFTSFYSLGYTPAHSGDGREHRLEVKVKRSGVKLRYRQSYRDKPVLEKAVDRTLAALLYGFQDNPLQVTVEVGEQTPGPDGSFNVPIRLRIPLFKLAILNRESVFEGSLRLLVATRDKDGRSSPVRQVAVPLQIPRKNVLMAMGKFYVYTLTLQLPPGEQRVAVAVRDELAATTSYLSHAVNVGAQAADARP